jgi:uncharacterized protein (DUF2141 family)
MKSMKMALLAAALAVSCGTATAGSNDAAVVIKNSSSWVLTELYVSSTGEDEWGPDQLEEQVIGSGETFKLNGVPCGEYDVKVVDEDGDSCVLEEVALCGGEDAWEVEDDVLLGCQAATDDAEDAE